MLALLGEAGSRSLGRIAHMLGGVLFDPGSIFSVYSLTSAFVIAMIFLAIQAKSVKTAIRAMFPKKLWASRSTRADAGFFLLNTLAVGLLFGWALISANATGKVAAGALTAAFGSAPQPHMPALARDAVMTLALFAAADAAYWFDHYLKHKIPALWAFHRVHHTAEVLTPLTVYRMHPVDSVIYYNITALALGLTHGALAFAMGGAHEASVANVNIVMFAFIFTVIHLQHSHIHIAFTGALGKVLFSPAHHHIHHSADPAHYGSNLGSCLAIWDWMAGTLILPERRSRPLKFGAGSQMEGVDPHGPIGGLVAPFIDAANALAPRLTAEPALGNLKTQSPP